MRHKSRRKQTAVWRRERIGRRIDPTTGAIEVDWAAGETAPSKLVKRVAAVPDTIAAASIVVLGTINTVCSVRKTAHSRIGHLCIGYDGLPAPRICIRSDRHFELTLGKPVGHIRPHQP